MPMSGFFVASEKQTGFQSTPDLFLHRICDVEHEEING